MGVGREALSMQTQSYVERQVIEEMKEGAVLSDWSLCVLVGGSFRGLSSSPPWEVGNPEAPPGKGVWQPLLLSKTGLVQLTSVTTENDYPVIGWKPQGYLRAVDLCFLNMS